jgi:hypothetical protein
VNDVISTSHKWGLGQLLVRLSVAPDERWIRRFDTASASYGTGPGLLALVRANNPCVSGDQVAWSGVPEELVPQALRYIAQKISLANRQSPAEGLGG